MAFEQPPLLGNVRLGSVVRLEPMTSSHAEALLASISSPEVWEWKPVARPVTIQAMTQAVTAWLGPSNRMPLVVVRRSDGRVVGSTQIYDIDVVESRAEIGWTWLARDCWGQGLNEDMKIVVLRICFEVLELARVAFRVDNLNERSQRALTRQGFTFEGTLRSHQFRLDGTRRDSLYLSVLKAEWPDTRARLEVLRDSRSGTSD